MNNLQKYKEKLKRKERHNKIKTQKGKEILVLLVYIHKTQKEYF